MGSCSSKEEFVIMNIGDRNFPRILFTSLCGENRMGQQLALSMRAAGLLGSLLDQLSRVHVPDDEQLEASESREIHTILLSDGNSYQLDTEFFRNYGRLRSTLNGIYDLMVTHSAGGTLPDYLDLSPFQNVLRLTLTDVPIHLVHYLKLLRPRLQCLRVHRCVDNLKKLFESCGGDQAFPALWTRLEFLDLRWNNLTTIDDSMQHLPFLHTLDLSYNRLFDIVGLECLTAIKVLNLSYNCLSALPSLMADSRKNLLTLHMRFNKVKSLQGIDEFFALRILDVSNNNVLDHREMKPLRHLRYLTNLNVHSNPFEVIQRVNRRQLLEHLNTLVPIDFMLNGQLLSGKENYLLRKVPVSRVPSSSTQMSMSLVSQGGHHHLNTSIGVVGLTQTDLSSQHWMEASQESTRRDITTGGSEADVSSSDAEGYLANSLTALARQTRHHLDHVRGRYGKNWLVNWNQSEIGRSIPSPHPSLIPSHHPGLPEVQSTPIATPTAVVRAPSETEKRPSEETVKQQNLASHCLPEEAEVETVDSPLVPKGVKDETPEEKEVPETETSSSQFYTTALSEINTSGLASISSLKKESVAEVYPLKWEHDEEVADLSVDGSTFVVTQKDSSKEEELDLRCMLVVGERHIQTCCITTGHPIETLELRLLTSVRREGSSLFLGFRYADPGQRSRNFYFKQSMECERCHNELARHLLDDPPHLTVGSGPSTSSADGKPRATMHCFRCRNRVPADKVARVLEVEPSTGERVLVPACPYCGFRALTEDSDDESFKSLPVPKNDPSPKSGHSSGSLRSQKSEKEEAYLRTALSHASPRLSASGHSSPSSLRVVSCDWIKFDHSDFTDFDHQIKYHFVLNVLQSDSEECRIMIKCHGTPYNRADVFECIVLFTNYKYYFFKWKYHESQTVAKCLSLHDKIDLKNLVSVRSGPCYQWVMLDFTNSKRCLLFPGDSVSSSKFIQQLSGALDCSVVNFNTEEDERVDFCTTSLSSLDQDSSEQLTSHHLYLSHSSDEDRDLISSVNMWVCRCPRSKYSSVQQLSNLSVWTGRESKRDWSLLILTNIHLVLFDVDYLVGMEMPKTKLVYKWSVTDVSSVKQGRDGITLIMKFYQPKEAAEKDSKFNDLPLIFESNFVVEHFFTRFKNLWEQFYGFPLKMK